MRILITGSKGHLGSALQKELKTQGFDVFGLDKYHSSNNEHAFTMGYAPPGTYFKCDVSEYRQLEKVIDYIKPDIVYHAAAEFGRWNGEDFYETLWKTNVIGTKHILTLQDKFNFKLVFFSSSEVYGDTDFLLTEDVMDEKPIKQLNDYAITKWANELQIENSKNKDNTTIVRLFNVYGPGEYYSPYRSVMCRLIYCCLNNIPFKIFKGHKRSHCYIGDVIKSLSNLINKPFGNKYNIGSNSVHSIEELYEIVSFIIGRKSNLVTYSDEEPKTSKLKNGIFDKAFSDLKLKETDLKEGISNTIEWMQAVSAFQIK